MTVILVNLYLHSTCSQYLLVVFSLLPRYFGINCYLLPNSYSVSDMLVNSSLLPSYLGSAILVNSYLITSYLVSATLVNSYLITSYLGSAILVNSYLTTSYLVSATLVNSYLITSYLGSAILVNSYNKLIINLTCIALFLKNSITLNSRKDKSKM